MGNLCIELLVLALVLTHPGMCLPSAGGSANKAGVTAVKALAAGSVIESNSVTSSVTDVPLGMPIVEQFDVTGVVGAISLVDVPAGSLVKRDLLWQPASEDPSIGTLRLPGCLALPEPGTVLTTSPEEVFLNKTIGKRVSLLFWPQENVQSRKLRVVGILGTVLSEQRAIDVIVRRSAVLEISRWWDGVRWFLEFANSDRGLITLFHWPPVRPGVGGHWSLEGLLKRSKQLRAYEDSWPSSRFRKFFFANPDWGNAEFF